MALDQTHLSRQNLSKTVEDEEEGETIAVVVLEVLGLVTGIDKQL